MVKTTLYLPDELKRALERLARARGVSEAALYRDALQRAVDSAERPRPSRNVGILPSRSGPNTSTDASRDEELLGETGFGES